MRQCRSAYYFTDIHSYVHLRLVASVYCSSIYGSNEFIQKNNTQQVFKCAAHVVCPFSFDKFLQKQYRLATAR